MTTPPTIQTNPLDPVFSGVPVIIPQGDLVNPTWNKWFVDLREKVNVINATLAAWSGITPVTGLTPGTYGDTTRYPIVTVNQYGMITAIATQVVSGGGNPMHVTNVSANYTVALSDLPATSANKGVVVTTSSGATVVSLDVYANTSIPVGSDLLIFQQGSGAASINALAGVTFQGPAISAGGQGSSGRAVQISQDVWAISGNLAYTSGGDPYWANVVSLLHFDGPNNSNTFSDQTGITWTPYGGAVISTAQYKFGGSSMICPRNTIAPIYTSDSSLVEMGTSDFTIEGWFLPGTPSSGGSPNGIVYVKGINTSGGLTLFVQNTLVGFRCNGVTDNTVTVSNITTWSHIAWVRASGVVTIYLNGISVLSVTISFNNNDTSTLDIGSNSHNGGNGSYSYSGYFDEFRITKGIARYTSNFTPPTAPFPNN